MTKEYLNKKYYFLNNFFHGLNKHVPAFLILQFEACKEADELIFIESAPLIAPLIYIPLVLPCIVPVF